MIKLYIVTLDTVHSYWEGNKGEIGERGEYREEARRDDDQDVCSYIRHTT